MNTAKINDPCKQCDSVIFDRCLDVYKVAGMPPCSKRAVENCHSIQHTQPAIVAQAADDWFAANGSVTVRQAFMAGVSWAQQQQASA